MWLRWVLIVLWAGVALGCDDDVTDEITPGSTAPTYAGSCSFDAAKTCDEYADMNADPGTAGRCAGSGGTWTAIHQCPLEARAAVCMQGATATRTYAYSTEAAAALEPGCPAGKFFELEGACNNVMRGVCDEYVGVEAVAGTGQRCESAGATWTSGGKCAMDGRSASCQHNAGSTVTYAYGMVAATALSSSCAAGNFVMIGGVTPPPPPASDEDAGI